MLADTMATFSSLEDSPMFRQQLNDLEGQVDGLKDRCKLLTKASKKYRDGLMSMHVTEKEFAVALEEVCIDNDDDHVSMGPFVTVLNQLASFHHTLYTQMEELLFDPLQRWQNTLGEVKDLRRRLDKCSLEYDEQRSKYLGMKKKTKQDVLEKQASELATARNDFEEARFAAARKLAQVDVRRKYEFLDPLASSMEAHMHFFRRGIDLFTGLEPKIHDALQTVEKQRSRERTETTELDALVQTQRDITRARNSAFLAETVNPAGPLQLTGQTARRAAEIETLIKASLESSVDIVIKQGYLFKRSSNMRGDYKRRFFILDTRGALCYYRNKNAAQATHTVNLLFSTIKPDAEDPTTRCCFRVVSPTKTFTLQAENEIEVMEWIESLQAVIAFLINNTTQEQLDQLLQESIAASAAAESRAGSGGGSGRHRRNLSIESDISVQSDGEFAVVERVAPRERATVKQLSVSPGDQGTIDLSQVPDARGSEAERTAEEKQPCGPAACFSFRRVQSDHNHSGPGPSSKDTAPTYITQTSRLAPSETYASSPYEVIRRVTGNHLCVDCGCEDPDWASLTYGVTLCIECSGVHRQMGVHISKVRSLTLDVKVWEPSVVEMFQALGNQFINSILEANVRKQQRQEESWLWSADSDGEEAEVEASNLGSRASASLEDTTSTSACKPVPSDPLPIKEKFIVAKYVDRRYRISTIPSAEQLREQLWGAVEKADIQVAMRCLLLGADANQWYSHPGAVNLMGEALELADELDIAVPVSASSNQGTLEVTLLHMAAKVGNVGTVQLLLQHGADHGLRDMYQRTPLHYCMLFNMSSAAKLLIRKGASASSVDLSNHTALDTAMRRGRVTDEELFVMLSDAEIR